MPFEDFEIYTGKKVSDLFKDIVTNSENTKSQIETLISDLRPLVKTPADALSITPMIRDYLDSGIKNDDALVKLAAVTQRMMNQGKQDSGDGGLMITDEERAELMKELKHVEVSQEVLKPNNTPKKKLEFEKLKEPDLK